MCDGVEVSIAERGVVVRGLTTREVSHVYPAPCLAPRLTIALSPHLSRARILIVFTSLLQWQSLSFLELTQ